MARLLALLASPIQLIAVVAFFLPFYSVSCQGHALATASGYEISTRGFDIDAKAQRDLLTTGAKTLSRPLPNGAEPWFLLFPVLAATASASAFLGSRRSASAAKARLTSALIGTVSLMVLLASYAVLRTHLYHLTSSRPGTDEGFGEKVAAVMLEGIALHVHQGWYLSLLALLTGSSMTAIAQLVAERESARAVETAHALRSALARRLSAPREQSPLAAEGASPAPLLSLHRTRSKT